MSCLDITISIPLILTLFKEKDLRKFSAEKSHSEAEGLFTGWGMNNHVSEVVGVRLEKEACILVC